MRLYPGTSSDHQKGSVSYWLPLHRPVLVSQNPIWSFLRRQRIACLGAHREDNLTFTRNDLRDITQTVSVPAKSKIITLVGVIQTFGNIWKVTEQWQFKNMQSICKGTLQSHSNLVEFAENDLETPESYAEAVIWDCKPLERTRSPFLWHDSNDQITIISEQDLGQCVDGSVVLIPYLPTPYAGWIVKHRN